ncbi:MAG: S8 family serine peptidase, partial [Bacteroidota bacterium]
MRYTTILSGLIICLFILPWQLSAQKLTHVQGDILIQLRPLSSGETVKAWVKRQRDNQGNPLQLEYAELISEYVNVHRIRFDYRALNERVVLAELRNNPMVLNAQFNHFVNQRTTIPNDPEFPNQWQYINTGQNGGTVGADLDMDLAWDLATGGLTANGDTIVACIIDDGIDHDHPDIAPNLWLNYHEIPGNGIDDDNNGYVDDYRGWSTTTNDDAVYLGGIHGTPVTGIVGAVGNNSVGVAGVNWAVKLMIVEGGTGVESEVLQAYSFPLEHRRRYNETDGAEGAFVVTTNASWGVDEGDPADSPLWCAFYDSLGVQGILNCGATANAEVDVDELGDLPTACGSDFLISVTNINRNDNKVNGAGYGLTTIDLGAFGEGTWTTNFGGSYGGFGGTSGATPHVAGAVALLYSLDCGGLMEVVENDPASAVLLVKQAILDGVDPNASLAGRSVTGGRLNVHNSLQILKNACPGCIAPLRSEVQADNDTLAVIDFTRFDPDATLDVRWRAVGTEPWDTITSVTAPLVLRGLVGCQSYEYQFNARCDTLSSGYGRSEVFTTEGCCTNPEVSSVSEITDSSATLTFEDIYAAVRYNVQYRLAEAGGWATLETDTNRIDFSNLAPCTEYEYRIQLFCSFDTLGYTDAQNFYTTGCGPCTDQPYCSSPRMSVRDEWIRSVSIGNLENSSSFGEDGYQDFTRTGPTADFHAYRNYDFRLRPGFSGGSFPEGWAIFMDFNQDGDFDEANELVFTAEDTENSTVTGQLNIPPEAALGYTRMRVFMEYDRTVSQACREESTGFGEVEDYCITIIT